MRKKVLLALLAAGEIVNAQSFVQAEEQKTTATDSVIERIAANTQDKPEVRAYHLLMVAKNYIGGMTQSSIDAQYVNVFSTPGETFRLSRWWDKNLIEMTNYACLSKSSSNLSKPNSQPPTTTETPLSEDAKVQANKAIMEALSLISQESSDATKLNMYLTASIYFRKLGNNTEAQKCDSILDKAFQKSENGPINENQIQAAASVLNSMAYGYAPVFIPDQLSEEGINSPFSPKQISRENFTLSEKLKLRATAMLDRLPAQADARRKAHRDLVFWYTKFQKNDLAEAQKQALFELVGSHDDSILYPQRGTCGRLVWWRSGMVIRNGACGMG